MSEPVLPEALTYLEEGDTTLKEAREHVLADLKHRAEQGDAKYGVPLSAHNGRDALIDLYEEVLDGYMYAVQYTIEEGVDADLDVIEQLSYTTLLVADVLQKRGTERGFLRNREPQPDPRQDGLFDELFKSTGSITVDGSDSMWAVLYTTDEEE